MRLHAPTLADLHSKGWVHGDVQPAHFILGPAKASLIDLALAHGGAIPERYAFPFTGCLVHYEAPEISQSVLNTGEAVPPRRPTAMPSEQVCSSVPRDGVPLPTPTTHPATSSDKP